MTRQSIRQELGTFFSKILLEENKNKKRKFKIMSINLLRELEKKPKVRFKTKRMLHSFEEFLNMFEK